MRFFTSLVVAVAAASHVYARALSTLEERSFTDICAQVDATLEVSILGIIQVGVGLLEICTCISLLPTVLSASVDATVLAGINLVGIATVEADVTALINSAHGKKSCFFPDHAVSICSAANPCDFSCSDGFVPSPPTFPTDCICPPPSIVCNGVCGKFGSVCPSAKPKRELEARSSGHCSHGFTACGVDSWSGMRDSEAWECVDTESDIESCGGCAIPLNPFAPRGTDCTTIPGVSDVSCHSGSCLVHRCLPGFVPSLDRTFCLRKSTIAKLAQENAAGAYGLEHVPFKGFD